VVGYKSSQLTGAKMLDDLKLIHERDPQDAFGVIEKQWQQLLHKYDVKINVGSHIENVVWAGMGGSALPAQISLSWPGYVIPFEICRNYEIPQYVNDKTLFIASSYSGETEEVLEALNQAITKKAQIIAIASDGKLAEIAQRNDYPLYLIPKGIQPRMTSLYFLKALADIYERTNLAQGLSGPLEAGAKYLETVAKAWRPDISTKQNPAKQLALELVGKSVVVYSGPKLQAVANKFKIALNENAKNIAWWNQLPEFNHNEFIGWSSHPLDKPYAVVDIRSNLEHPRVQKRFEISAKLLSGKRPAPHIIEPQGNTLLEQMLWGLVFCDFVSLYLAILNGLNPTPVELVERLKTEMAK
jgi:glucose/mannose-6-phosphate isomerase